MSRIEKNTLKSLELIGEINKKRTFLVKVNRTRKHAYSDRKMLIWRKKEKYAFKVTTLIRKGIQNEAELEVNRKTEIEFDSRNIKLHSSGKNLIVLNINYHDFEDFRLEKEVTGEITSLSTKKEIYYSKNRYYRAIIPLYKDASLRGNFTGWHYSIDGKTTFEPLIKINIIQSEYHFFIKREKNKQIYFVIDCLSKQPIESFKLAVNSIMLSYAFLKGDYHGREIYILTFNSHDFIDPKSILTYILGGGIYGGFLIHTTNPYNFEQIRRKIKYKTDSSGQTIGIDDSKLKRYMVEFPSDVFERLCELICTKGGILRAVILFVSNTVTTLEMKVPTLFVALENMTKVLTGGDETPPKIIDDTEIEQELKVIVRKSVKEIRSVKKRNKPLSLSELEEKEYNANFERIITKLYNFNRGTNNKKLVEPFANFGYTLSKEEEDLLIIHRNKFLHGDDYLGLDTSYELEFKELFHITLRLQKLIAVLLLKEAGYSGFIVNNAKVYQYITEKKLKEPVFVKI